MELQKENESLGKTLQESNEYYLEVDKKLERYEKALKDIASDEKDCRYQLELGFTDYYDGYRKTDIALESLKG